MNPSPRRSAALALIAAALVASGASAQTIRRPAIVTPRAPLAPQAPAVTVPAGPKHQVFGTIASLTKTAFVLRTRTGRTIDVNAADAISSGRYSEPLFVGKVVVVTGPTDAHGVLYAQTVIRMTRIEDPNLRDR
jgi:hypothetical protein